MNADIHTVFDRLDEVRRSKGAVYHGDHSWERLDQLTKGFKIKDRHCGVCRTLSIENLWVISYV